MSMHQFAALIGHRIAHAGPGTPGLDYARLAVGRDFADLSPLRGVLQGGAKHTLQAQVTVAPLVD
jgi:transglutaminase-like putative cysteine protease